ncbi:hypothetical protein CNMCM5793_001850 [Aspergillus hiratsukae]|uniref:Cytochrome P450 n=1 Tax=Aspergillus hiratsukae TaxID=1194566 RepID=A0A8H6PD04_9EURO|nr:hypothetical protein CNMCM5793_001850 [Aspergillus hiratsukae]KAF7155510.1 hypothetical protein CNMCM6106_004656 [Aspergillus hiratsukae]
MPIFTLFLGFQKVYVVNSPALISQINRRQKVIDSNPPFLTIVMGKLFDFHKDDLAELLRNPNEMGSLRRETRGLEHSLLERGAAPLHEIFTAMIQEVATRLNTLASKGPVTIKLECWLRETITMCTAQAVFGPHNPFAQNHSLLDDFWQFESGIKGLTMGIFPTLTASGAARARHRLVQAFHRFVQGHFIESEETCELVRQIGEVAHRHNRGTDYLARYYFGVFSAFLLNTVPVTFWTISHIIKNPDLLARIRTELEDVARESVKADGIRMRMLDISTIRERCPLLLSTFHETLRYVGASTSTLVVHEDVWLDDTYLLTKGSLVQIPATAIHSDPNIWGPDAEIFDPERFHVAPNKVHPSANRTFGGGNTLCPGRHLASDEVLEVTAMFLSTFNVGFEAEPSWPRRDETNMLSVIKPRDDLSLKLTRYPNMEKVLWGFETS